MEATPIAATPLALASIAIIAIVGVLKLMVKGRNNALNRMITHYGFATVLVFGLVGNASYLYREYLSSESLILGVVTDSDGKYLPHVEIDAGGRARGLTSDSGDFVLAIPASRSAPQYELTASLPGYERQTATVGQHSKAFVAITLNPKKYTARDIISLSDPQVVIGHFLGVPEVYVPIRIDNPTPTTITLNDFSASITAPSGKTRNLSLVNGAVTMNGPMLPPIATLQLKPGEFSTHVQIYVQLDQATNQLAQQAVAQLRTNQSLMTTGPRFGVAVLDDAFARSVTSTMTDNWFWEAGKSLLSVTCNVSGTRFELSRAIRLSESAVAAMKGSKEFYESGFGLVFGQDLVPVGSIQPGVVALTFEK